MGLTARRALLILALCSTAITLVWIGAREVIHYDGYWHIFIASQQSWNTFWEEVGSNAHPPLYYLLLKLSKSFGRSPLLYRSVSIVATLGCVWLVAQVGSLTTRTMWPSVLAAFAFGLSLNTISIGLEVRAYMLSVFFMLAAFHAYLLLVEGGFGDRDLKRRVTFVVCASLALMTHYSAAFLMAACLAGPVPSAVADRSFRGRLAAGLRRRAVLNALTFGVPWLCLALLFVHLRSLSATGWPVNHLTDYVFDPSRESVAAFLFHGARGMLELLFPPVQFPGPTSTLMIIGPQLGPAGGGATLVLLSIGLALLAYAVCVSPSTRSVTASATLTVAMVLLCIIAVAAVAGKYPFGGSMRHQYLLMPFALVVVFTALDQVLQRLDGWKARVIVCLAACAVAANAIAWMSHFRTTPGYLGQAEMNRLRTLFPDAPVIYVDQFNLIQFFTHHHERDWKLVRRLEERGLDLWQVSDAYETFHVCRDKKRWLLDFADPSLYYDFAACLDSSRASSVVIFRPQQHDLDLARPTESTREFIPGFSARAKLIGTRVAIEGEDVYAEFRKLDAATAGDLLLTACPRGIGEPDPLAGKFADGWLSLKAEGCLSPPHRPADLELKLFLPDAFPLRVTGVFTVDQQVRRLDLGPGLNILRVGSADWHSRRAIDFVLRFDRGVVPSTVAPGPDTRELTAIFKGLEFVPQTSVLSLR